MTLTAHVVTDHAAWTPTGAGWVRLLGDDDGGRRLVDASPDQLDAENLVEVSLPPGVAAGVPELVRELSRLGTVVRWRNTSLWDAIATGIIRQVIRADHAAGMYRRFCTIHGAAVEVDGERLWLFPRPEVVLELPDAAFTEIGAAFKRPALRAAAVAFCDHGRRWRTLPAVELVEALQAVSRIGPWTAGAAAADWSNDFSVYPYADLAVRTWARRAAPSHIWPQDESGFGQLWRDLAGDHLSALTLLTLAWGRHHADHTRPVSDRRR